jgi:hypothetical protein
MKIIHLTVRKKTFVNTFLVSLKIQRSQLHVRHTRTTCFCLSFDKHAENNDVVIFNNKKSYKKKQWKSPSKKKKGGKTGARGTRRHTKASVTLLFK